MKQSKIFLTAASLVGLLLITTPLTMAQTAQSSRKEGAGKATGAFKINNLYDYEVVNQRNEVLGTVTDFVVTPQGRIQYAALSPASWWGSSDRVFLVPWRALTTNREAGRLVLNMSQERLQNAPSFTTANWPNLASSNWDASVQRFYGQQMAQQDQQHTRSSQRGQQWEQQSRPRAGDETLIQTSVLFDFAEARLSNEARATLDRLAAQLRNREYAAIHLTGQADPVGSDEVNFDIARRRAARVAAYLVEQGVEPRKIRTLSLGSETAAMTGEEGSSMAQDRRVDISVLRPRMASGSSTQGETVQQGQQSQAGGARLSGTVQDIDMNSGTLTLQTEYGDSVELSAGAGMLQSLQEGDRIEVRLRKVDGTSQQ